MKRYSNQENFQMLRTPRSSSAIVIVACFLLSTGSIWAQTEAEPQPTGEPQVDSDTSSSAATLIEDDVETSAPVITKDTLKELSAEELANQLLRIDEFSEEEQMVIALEVQRRDNEKDRPVDRSTIESSFGKKVEVADTENELPRLEETSVTPPISTPYSDSGVKLTSDPRDNREKKLNTRGKPAYVPKN